MTPEIPKLVEPLKVLFESDLWDTMYTFLFTMTSKVSMIQFWQVLHGTYTQKSYGTKDIYENVNKTEYKSFMKHMFVRL